MQPILVKTILCGLNMIIISKMEIVKTELKGCYIIKPKIFSDERGYFYESFNQSDFNRAIG
ncbi:hypothetical protein GCM10010831_03350 [Psychroflexus salis]|uniref:dTDP-4-dehydrorhamnose 3,5-epimerase n=1 Tax=Psychroflexus salis TaxID=1526574 RepID=A0A916ZMQ2_9FLAO|nr:hypothetical protein GCM10010831_03350 [Psychroflexus salis]